MFYDATGLTYNPKYYADVSVCTNQFLVGEKEVELLNSIIFGIIYKSGSVIKHAFLSMSDL